MASGCRSMKCRLSCLQSEQTPRYTLNSRVLCGIRLEPPLWNFAWNHTKCACLLALPKWISPSSASLINQLPMNSHLRVFFRRTRPHIYKFKFKTRNKRYKYHWSKSSCRKVQFWVFTKQDDSNHGWWNDSFSSLHLQHVPLGLCTLLMSVCWKKHHVLLSTCIRPVGFI